MSFLAAFTAGCSMLVVYASQTALSTCLQLVGRQQSKEQAQKRHGILKSLIIRKTSVRSEYLSHTPLPTSYILLSLPSHVNIFETRSVPT